MKLKRTFLLVFNKWSFWLIFFCAGLFTWIALGIYENQFSIIAAKLTNLAVGNGWNIRSYDDRGIPYSYIARLRKKETSPYYVVHYGLIYSQSLSAPHGYDWLWLEDKSFRYWGEEPPENLITKQNFLHAANWIIERIKKNGSENSHIYYNFSWPYKGTSQGFLLAPWYSGLTDSVAIKLLLRSYLVTKEMRYLDAASSLYHSVLRPIDKGGSLIFDEQGHPWIEEYVARNNTKNPFVLNGMIYATLAICEYERFMAVDHPMGDKLIETIKLRLPEFDAGYWSRYDLIGTLAKPKYHRIHVALINMLYEKTNDRYFMNVASHWEEYNTHFIVRNFLKGYPSINSLVVFSLSVSAWLLITFIVNTILIFVRWIINHTDKKIKYHNV